MVLLFGAVWVVLQVSVMWPTGEGGDSTMEVSGPIPSREFGMIPVTGECRISGKFQKNRGKLEDIQNSIEGAGGMGGGMYRVVQDLAGVYILARSIRRGKLGKIPCVHNK